MRAILNQSPPASVFQRDITYNLKDLGKLLLKTSLKVSLSSLNISGKRKGPGCVIRTLVGPWHFPLCYPLPILNMAPLAFMLRVASVRHQCSWILQRKAQTCAPTPKSQTLAPEALELEPKDRMLQRNLTVQVPKHRVYSQIHCSNYGYDSKCRSHTHTHVYIYKYIHTHIHIHEHIHIQIPIHIHMQVRIHMQIHIQVHIHIHMYMYIYIYVCMQVYIHIYTYIYVYTYTSIHVCIHMYICIFMHIYIYTYILYIYTDRHLYTHISIYIYISACMHICLYLYTYLYMYYDTHIHMCIRTYIYICMYMALLSFRIPWIVPPHPSPEELHPGPTVLSARRPPGSPPCRWVDRGPEYSMLVTSILN